MEELKIVYHLILNLKIYFQMRNLLKKIYLKNKHNLKNVKLY